MSEACELLLGCGHARDKRISTADYGGSATWRGLVTLDHNPHVKPDIVCDLDRNYWEVAAGDGWHHPAIDVGRVHFGSAPLRSDYFDEVHAYEVLEHLGQQGDALAFFSHFSEIWRILKPGGLLCATVPARTSVWLWGDPSHRRVICTESLIFLDQRTYKANLDGPIKTAMSDFRSMYKADFRKLQDATGQHQYWFILQAVKS